MYLFKGIIIIIINLNLLKVIYLSFFLVLVLISFYKLVYYYYNNNFDFHIKYSLYFLQILILLLFCIWGELTNYFYCHLKKK